MTALYSYERDLYELMLSCGEYTRKKENQKYGKYNQTDNSNITPISITLYMKGSRVSYTP